jgi:hypothetical protein
VGGSAMQWVRVVRRVAGLLDYQHCVGAFRGLVMSLSTTGGQKLSSVSGKLLRCLYSRLVNVCRALYCAQQLRRVIVSGGSMSVIKFAMRRLRAIPHRLYITGRKRGVFYSLLDGCGRSVFTFSGGMIARVRAVVGRTKLLTTVRKKKSSVKSKKTSGVVGGRVRKLRTIGGGRKPRDKKKVGGLKRRSSIKLYYNQFKHHLRPLVAFLAGEGSRTFMVRQVVIVVRGRWFYNKVGERLLVKLVRTLRQINRRLVRYGLRERKKEG